MSATHNITKKYFYEILPSLWIPLLNLDHLVKIPTGLRLFGILLHDAHRAGRLTANIPYFKMLLNTWKKFLSFDWPGSHSAPLPLRFRSASAPPTSFPGSLLYARTRRRNPGRGNTAVKRNAHVRDLRKRGKNKGKLYTKECGLNKNTKYKKTPENIR